MSVRFKVWIAMGMLILWMSVAFFGISHIYLESQFRQYSVAFRQQQAHHWSGYLANYYESHHSWQGIEQAVQSYAVQQAQENNEFSLVSMDIRTLNQRQIAHIVVSNTDTDDSLGNSDESGHAGTTLPVRVNGQTVAVATVVDRDLEGQEALEAEALHSMAVATLLGLILTGIISLVAAGLLSRKLTSPLEVMMGTVRKIASGDLSTRAVVRSNDEFARLATALNDMSKDLDAAVQARRHLVADVAHELRTPVTIIQGQLDLLQDGMVPTTPASMLPVQDEVLRLRTLIDELHQLALAESHQLELHRQPLELVAWFGQLLEKFGPDASAKEIPLQLDPQLDQAWVDADPHRLTQVFSNLMSNAIRYTPTHGQIKVVIRRVDDSSTTERDRPFGERHRLAAPAQVVLEVSNTGPGISEDKITHVFDRFFRTEEARSREYGGMGLGLAIAKELVELHDGTIRVRSEAGVWTTFTVTLNEYMR